MGNLISQKMILTLVLLGFGLGQTSNAGPNLTSYIDLCEKQGLATSVEVSQFDVISLPAVCPGKWVLKAKAVYADVGEYIYEGKIWDGTRLVDQYSEEKPVISGKETKFWVKYEFTQVPKKTILEIHLNNLPAGCDVKIWLNDQWPYKLYRTQYRGNHVVTYEDLEPGNYSVTVTHCHKNQFPVAIFSPNDRGSYETKNVRVEAGKTSSVTFDYEIIAYLNVNLITNRARSSWYDWNEDPFFMAYLLNEKGNLVHGPYPPPEISTSVSDYIRREQLASFQGKSSIDENEKVWVWLALQEKGKNDYEYLDSYSIYKKVGEGVTSSGTPYKDYWHIEISGGYIIYRNGYRATFLQLGDYTDMTIKWTASRCLQDKETGKWECIEPYDGPK